MRSKRKKQLTDYIDLASNNKSSSKDFYIKVYEVVERIPKGKVTTYGAIAELLGRKGSARMVGAALGAIPEDYTLSPHRVINRIGALSAAHKFGSYSRMRKLLEREGITFIGERVDMKKHFWQPK